MLKTAEVCSQWLWGDVQYKFLVNEEGGWGSVGGGVG